MYISSYNLPIIMFILKSYFAMTVIFVEVSLCHVMLTYTTVYT